MLGQQFLHENSASFQFKPEKNITALIFSLNATEKRRKRCDLKNA